MRGYCDKCKHRADLKVWFLHGVRQNTCLNCYLQGFKDRRNAEREIKDDLL